MNDQRHADARTVIDSGIENRVHPRQIRDRLRTLGLPSWKYEVQRHQGNREKQRRMRQGRLCAKLCGRERSGSTDLCVICLTAKWGGTN